jgi:hypothetical protein
LLDMASRDATSTETEYLRLVEARIARGNLSERIRTEVEKRARTDAGRRDALRAVYEELSAALAGNTPWKLA